MARPKSCQRRSQTLPEITAWRRRLRFEPLEDRRLLAALVGIDFDEVGGGASPSNWTRIPNLDDFFTINLRDETGVNTPYTVIATTNVGPADRGVLESDPVAAATLPMHTQSLAGLDGFAFAETVTDATITVTFGNLDVNRLYEVYVFGFDGDGLSDTQEVAIGGAGAGIIFTQSPSSNQLWVNGELGTSARSLESFAELVQPNFLQDIVISARRISGAAVLGGVAIRDAGILVNSTGDTDDMNAGNGVTTLREAIRLTNANPGAETIAFDTTVFASPQTINLGSQLPTITDALTIIGPGKHLLTLDAGNGADGVFATGDGYRIFDIGDLNFSNQFDVEISGLTLTGGDAANGSIGSNGQSGGAIRSSENLTLVNSTVSGNAAGSGGDYSSVFEYVGDGGDGGGIFSVAGALTITGSTISFNRAGNGGNGSVFGDPNGSGGNGGGIFSRGGTLTISSSTIHGNQTGSQGVDGIGGAGGNGGGIWIVEADATIDRSTISGNIALGHGGAIFGDLATTTTITNSTITGNQATTRGGALYGVGSGGGFATAIVVISSTLSGNSAQSGGAAFISLQTTLELSHSTITGNQAASGGGVATNENPILSNSRTLRIQNSIVAGNADLDIREGAHTTIDILGRNLVGTSNATVFRFDPTTLFGVDPLLGPLADHGGPTKTHALLPGSPALDAVGMLDNFSSNQFLASYNFVDLFSSADNNPQVAGGAAHLNVGTGTGAFIWKLGEKLSAVGDRVSVDFGFNYPIATAGYALSSAGLALFDSPSGANLLAELRVETDKVNGNSTLRLNNGIGTTTLTGTPSGLMTLSVVVTGASPTTRTVQYTLSGNGIANITGSRTFDTTEIYFGPVAFDVSGAESVHDNLVFSPAGGAVFDQRGLPRPMNGGNALRPDIGAYEAQIAPSADFDSDGDVDGRDFLLWQRGYGMTTGATKSDGNSDDDGDVDASDLAAWQMSYGDFAGDPLKVVSGEAHGAEALVELSAAGSEPQLIEASVPVHASAPIVNADSLANATESASNNLSVRDRFYAALAWEGFDKDTTDEVLVAARESVLAELDFDILDDGNWGPLETVSAPEERSPSQVDRFDDNVDLPWLAEELLEKVFG